MLQHAGTGAAGLFLIGIGVAVVWFVSLARWAVTVALKTAFLAKVVAVYADELAPAVPPQVITFGSLTASLAACITRCG